MTPRVSKVYRFGIGTGLALVPIWSAVEWWFGFVKADSLPVESVRSASNGIIQLDSFIVAGFVVGFFYFWERLESHFEKNPHREPMSFLIAVFPPVTVISIVLSGILADGAILTANPWYLKTACELLIFGLWAVFFSWYTLQLILEDVESKQAKLSR